MLRNRRLEWSEYTKVNTELTKSKERVVKEIGLSIFINKRHFTTVMMTPMMEKEFVIGHLVGQRVIENITDIQSMTIKDNVAEVVLPEIKDEGKGFPMIYSDLRVRREDVFKGVKVILESKVFAETEALHSAGLFKPGAEPICIAEDIGRHNALDKVLGYGLINGVDLGNAFVTSTGRQPAEMILRCCNANIPIMATKGVPTTLAVDIARKAGLTIVGLVSGNGMTVYSNPARIR